MNIGYSSRLTYDDCYYNDHLEESVAPLQYRLSANNIANCNACLSTLGPRSGYNGYGVSHLASSQNLAPAQALVEVDSLLTNRNVPLSKCRTARVNNIDVNDFNLTNPRICDEFLDSMSSRLTYPPLRGDELSSNRFYDIARKTPIFYDWSVNSQLEARDNYSIKSPNIRMYDPSIPREIKGNGLKCTATCGAINPVDCHVI
jgi:hypothetical protein